MRHGTAIKPRDSLQNETLCLPSIVSREVNDGRVAGRYEKRHMGGRSARQCAGGVRLAQRANRELSQATARHRGEGMEDSASGA